MWNPDNDTAPELKAAELIQSLCEDEKIREYCGIKANGDGTYWVGDLERIKAQSDETKAILRDFLRKHGKRPITEGSKFRVDTTKALMSKKTRAELDALYKKIEGLLTKAEENKFI